MRLGGLVFDDCSDPDAWVGAHKRSGYSAAYCPVDESADDAVIEAYAEAAADADIVIAEVGVWNSPIGPDDEARRKAVALCEQRLALADKIGARCCVNIAGSRGEKWDGPCADDLTEATFDLIVETTRGIIDSVKPTRTFYTLETMPWMHPDSPESYARLIEAIDRPQFAVHLDPTNLVCSPQRFFNSGALIQECFTLLGPHIKSCHAKDVALSEHFMVHLDEVRPGLGKLNYEVFLRELEELDPDTPLMLEHLPNEEEYALAAGYIRSVAKNVGVTIR